jgi:DNA modification methylase
MSGDEKIVSGQHKALSVVYLPIAALKPASRNARTHSPEQIVQLQRSITEFGWTNPILIDDAAGIVAGHGRLQAAIALGMTEVPTITLTGLSAAQKRALIIADNKLAMNAGWDDDLLRAELGELGIEGFDLSLIGFSDTELAGFLDVTEGLTDPDDVPDAPAVPVTVLGDVWLLGRHRLVCGDSCTVESVDACLAGVKPHLMVTDPPYGVSYDADWRNKALRVDGSPTDGRAIGKVEYDDRADWSEAWALFSGDVIYTWHAGNMAHTVADSLIAAGFEIRSQIIWAKSQFVIGRGHYHPHHEPCWYAVRKGATGHWAGDRKQTTLWQIPKPQKSETGHSTQKPVECMKRPIENNSNPGQAVYEPFSGSGTTIIAAEMTGRACHAIELSPAYVDVAVLRWQAFAGGVATLEGDGRTFEQVASARVGMVDAAD